MKNKKIILFGLAMVFILFLSVLYIKPYMKIDSLEKESVPAGKEIGRIETEELIFELERVDVPIILNNNYETDEKMVAHAGNNRDNNFFMALIFTDFKNKNTEYYVSYLPQNIQKLQSSEYADKFRGTTCIPHHSIEAEPDIFYVFTYGPCDYFYKFDLENMQMEVITADTLGLNSAISFVDTAFEENGELYFSTLEKVDTDNKVNVWYKSSLDLSYIEKIYESDESPVVHHSTRFFEGLILSAPFSYSFKIRDDIVFNSFNEFVEYVHSETGEDKREIRSNPYGYLSEYEFVMLPDTLRVVNPNEGSIEFYDTSASLAGHLEEFKGKMYVSNHNFLIDSILRVYIIAPATMDKFEYIDGEMFLSDTFEYEYGVRYTSHVLGEYEGMDYLVTIGFPNRLLIVNTEDMSLYRKIDIGEPYIEKAEEENYDSGRFLRYINEDIGTGYRNSMLALETIEGGEKVVIVSGNGNVYVYSLSQDEIIDVFSLSPGDKLGTEGTYSIIPHHVNIV